MARNLNDWIVYVPANEMLNGDWHWAQWPTVFPTQSAAVAFIKSHAAQTGKNVSYYTLEQAI